MRVRLLVALVAPALAGCTEPSAETAAASEPSAATPDAAAPVSIDPEPDLAADATPDPAFHLDPDPVPTRAVDTRRRRRARPIELILRSTPAGAIASVDGRPVGTTPTYWAGTADGRPRDVTFALPGYAVARYRFIAVRSGVVHGSLRRLAKPEPDGSPGSGEPANP